MNPISFFTVDDSALKYVVTHVFFPVVVPCESDYTVKNDYSLVRAVCAAAHAYAPHIDNSFKSTWNSIVKMLDNLQASVRSERLDTNVVLSQLGSMESEDILAFLVRTRRAAVIFRKRKSCTTYEPFEVSPRSDAVMDAGGVLERSYAGIAIEIPSKAFEDAHFQAELADFLSLSDEAGLPEHTTTLLTGIPRSVGHVIEGPCIVKHVRDDVGQGCQKRWRRSSLWLLIRVAIQTSLGLPFSSPGRAAYKEFMLFFICNLAMDAHNTRLSSDLLHLMSSKILRRLSKLDSLTSSCLSAMALETCSRLQDTLDVRAMKLRAIPSLSPQWNPSGLDLIHDTQISLPIVDEYIRSALVNHGYECDTTPFQPKDYHRGTLDDFLSTDMTFFSVAYNADPYVALYDVERLVEQEIDHWISNVTNVSDACVRLGMLMDSYLLGALVSYTNNPECRSVTILTVMELWVALDRLVVAEIPRLSEYSPEIPVQLLESLLLREATNLQRLSCIYHYLSTRHSASRSAGLSMSLSNDNIQNSSPIRYDGNSLGLNLKALTGIGMSPHIIHQQMDEDAEPLCGVRSSVLSHKFTAGSFPIRYYDDSPSLQSYETLMEMEINGYKTHKQAGKGEGSEKSSPSIPSLYLKAIAFELQCPALYRIWRSAIAHVLYHFHPSALESYTNQFHALPLSEFPELQSYFVKHPLPECGRFRLTCLEGVRREKQKLGYAFKPGKDILLKNLRRNGICHPTYYDFFYRNYSPDSQNTLAECVGLTHHTSNFVLSSQAASPPDYSPDEFIAFGHMRSGGPLQWISILRELRGRTLNFHSDKVHFLLAQATSEVGPLDAITGEWVWHRELQDPSFCDLLLNELKSLFVEVSATSMEEATMHTISLLVTRILASSPSGDILERALLLLRHVRSKTLKWVQELAHNLMEEPMHEQRRERLYNMAATCRSTFDVGTSAFHKVLHSAEDVQALLSSAFFMRAARRSCRICDLGKWSRTGPDSFQMSEYHTLQCEHKQSSIYNYSELLYQRMRRLSVAIEGILKDVILGDASDRGIDLALRDIWPGYKPGPKRWVLEHPKSHWLVSTTAVGGKRNSQIVHINLLDGSLLIDGKPLVGLPHEIVDHPLYRQLFNSSDTLLVVPSDLPGMDFATLSMISDCYVHFSLRGNKLVIRTQHQGTNQVSELVPREIFKDDLPSSLIEHHYHWLDLSTSVVEIRPSASHYWKPSQKNWKIAGAHCGKYHVYKECDFLVDIRSQTWTMVSRLLKGLDSPKNLVVTTGSSSAPQLSVALPFHGLSFFVNSNGELESHDFRRMVCDRNQDVGTLFGLTDRLVLRAKGKFGEGPIPRCILIPRGPFTDNDFFKERGTTYDAYKVDTELGCLTGNSSLESKEFLAHLHMKTSINWWPDPLTGRTGAQEALRILQSAGYRSLLNFHGAEEFYYSSRHILPQYPQIVIARLEALGQSKIYEPNMANAGDMERDLKHCACRIGRAAYLFPSNNSIQKVPVGKRTTPHVLFPSCSLWQVTLDCLFFKRHAPELPCPTRLRQYYDSNVEVGPSPSISSLDQLFSSLRMHEGDPPFQEQYIVDLHASASYVHKEYQTISETIRVCHIEDLETHLVQCRRIYKDALHILKESLGPTANPLEQSLARGGQWPQITAHSLLQFLASSSPIRLSKSWKTCLISFALILLECQHARRLFHFALEGLEEELSKELEYEGCDGWNVEEHTDWLLIQLQGDFVIRRTQVGIAMEMISPRSGKNAVMQVNMGEGKSSVIVPIVAATLADGHQLVRIIVPKALTVQMFQILVDRLGGLANRPIYYLPFSRSTHLKGLKIKTLSEKMSQCMEARGILLVQPEHLLSLNLASVETQLSEHKPTALSSLQPQKSIHQHVLTGLSFSKYSHLSNVLHGLCKPFHYSSSKQTTSYAPQNDVFTQKWFASPQHELTIQSSSQLWEPVHRYNRAASSPYIRDIYYSQVTRDLLVHSTAVRDMSQRDESDELLELQKWLRSHARDILDESDDILHSRRQLIYTVGHQQQIEGCPDRWIIIQQVLRLVKRHAYPLSQDLPDSVEYRSRQPGSFPHFRILQTSDAGRRLILLLVGDVMAGHLPAFDFRFISETQRDAIRSFISSENVQHDRTKDVEEYAKSSQQRNLWNGLLLLRGLFASNILLFALTERRWRVDYGLNLFWRRLAVPFRTKDVPLPDTQFGHPDTTILLTCLSYYYAGLNMVELRHCFQKLLKEDDPAMEYALWVQDSSSTSLPASLRELKELNLGSSEQWDKYLFPFFAYNQATIDFYLSRVVFPREAKEYPWKLATSSWDLAEIRERPITGFSGTNDSRYLLPISITQHELDHQHQHQQGANARILAYLLRPENDSYMLIAHRNGQRVETTEFLKMIVAQQPEIRVLLDVGAHVLYDFNLVQEWLDLSSAEAAVYYGDDEPKVLQRNGTRQPLTSSPFAQRLDRCVIYLDDAHTRGTDLKFPKGFRAAVTLGPKMTKDRLVQGCMRMRKLGRGHSLMFFAPLEVDQSIRSVAHKEDQNIRITTADILKWAIHETWTDIRQWAPHWAQQGMSHKTRHDAWSCFCNNEITRDKLADAWLQPETKSLADLYAPSETQSHPGSSSLDLGKDIRRRCEDLGVAISSVQSAARLDEQLERQVNREIEREREVELPPAAEPAEHSLHPDVAAFVKTGVLRASSAFRPIFTNLETSSAPLEKAHSWSPFLLATADFCETITHLPKDGKLDQYLRPVQWVLSGKKKDHRVLVVLSPFEVELLLPDIRMNEHVHLHVYVPRTSERMEPTDDLKFYSIPPVPDDWTPPWDLIDQLNLFAGQVYLRDWDAYLRLSQFLDLRKKPGTQDKTGRGAWYNLFNLVSLEMFVKEHPESLLPSIMMLLNIRRRGLPFSETHMGRILQGRELTEMDFERTAVARGTRDQVSSYHGQQRLGIGPISGSLSVSNRLCVEDSVASSPKRTRPKTDQVPESESGGPQKRQRLL